MQFNNSFLEISKVSLNQECTVLPYFMTASSAHAVMRTTFFALGQYFAQIMRKALEKF